MTHWYHHYVSDDDLTGKDKWKVKKFWNTVSRIINNIEDEINLWARNWAQLGDDFSLLPPHHLFTVQWNCDTLLTDNRVENCALWIIIIHCHCSWDSSWTNQNSENNQKMFTKLLLFNVVQFWNTFEQKTQQEQQ